MVDWILSIISQVVSPDWGQLVGLIPLGVAAIVGLYLLFLVRRAVTAPPRRVRRLGALPTPDGIHMPGPSLAPLLAAIGAMGFFLALLFVRVGPVLDPATKQPVPNSTTWTIAPFGIVALVVGVVALAAGLLYWGREATRDYDALEPPTAIAAGAQAGPPPGVHVPGPSFRPFLFALAGTTLLLGVVVNVAIALGGIAMLVVALLGWLRDARLEYREVERADQTGHLENIPAPRFPTGTLVAFGLIFAVTTLMATGLLPPRTGTSTAAAGAATSAKPAASGGAAAATPPGSTGGAGGAVPTPVPGGGGTAAATLDITAAGIQFDKTDLAAPADKPFAITFTNNDAGIPHDVAIRKDSPTGQEVWKGDIFAGVATRTYQVPALAAGTYAFVCTVHPNMTGTLVVK